MKGWHRLKPNKKTVVPQCMVFVDTETEKADEGNGNLVFHKLKLGVAKYVRLRELDKIEEDVIVFRNAGDFWQWLVNKGRKKVRIYVFSHNFHFDFNILGGFKALANCGLKVTKFVIDSDMFFVMAKGNHRSFAFIDTTNYFKTSLEELGKVLGLPKLKIDFDKCTMEELETYCQRDVDILEKLVMELISFIKLNNLGGFAVSSASLSFNIFRHRFMKHEIFIHRHPKALELETLSYRGGRNEAFRLGRLEGEKFYMLDVSSMYPFVMLNNYYPVKLIRVEENPSLRGLLDALTKFLVIADVEVEIWKPCIAVKRDKLIFPIGRFRCVLTTPELLMVLQEGEIKQVYSYAIYEYAKIFEDYVRFFYELKEKYQREGNRPFREFSKLLMNSLYGKFGQRVRKIVKIGEGFEEDNHIELLIDARNGTRSVLIYLNGELFVVDKADYSEHSFPAIASFVTAYARCYLTRLIDKAGWENVIYCDTDSLLVTTAGYEKLKRLIRDGEIGLLKLEGVYDFVEIIGCKHYRLGEEVIKLKGVRKDAVKVSDNLYLQPQFLKTKTLLRKALDGAVCEKIVEKNLRLVYDKRRVLENGLTEPFILHPKLEALSST